VAGAVRRAPNILLSVDANSAYLDDGAFEGVDAFNLLMIEQRCKMTT
jgi:hypothetical protein